jgi:hypothetical protein
MQNLTPRHINEVESDRRGVKDGWYSINGGGKLGLRSVRKSRGLLVGDQSAASN